MAALKRLSHTPTISKPTLPGGGRWWSPRSGVTGFVSNLKQLRHFSTFSFILFIYLLARIQKVLRLGKIAPAVIKRPVHTTYTRLMTIGATPQTLNRETLIDIAFKNMFYKKNRAFVTIGGVAIGIGVIVYLVSLGYGVNKLVIDRVASLEEMLQADVVTQAGSQVVITDETVNNLRGISDVQLALPMITVVAKVQYQNSESDMAVYGVTADYLKQSAIKPTQGEFFQSNDFVQKVAGVSDEAANPAESDESSESVAETPTVTKGDALQAVTVNLPPGSWTKVRSEPGRSAKVLGYTRDGGSQLQGTVIVGDSFVDSDSGRKYQDEEGTVLGEWIRSELPLWEKKSCDQAQPGCVDGEYLPLTAEDGSQLIAEGHFANIDATVQYETGAQVLGETTEASASATATISDQGDDWVELTSESSALNAPPITKVAVQGDSARQAVVNTAMLSVLGIPASEALGKEFSATFHVVGSVADETEQIVSTPTSYKIVGVVPEDKAPYFYVPFVDLRSLGIQHFSQVKVVVGQQEQLAQVRQKIEAMGYMTHSVVDTVAQIDSLFATARKFLALLGMVALSIASLGMFNTLTVSLLERTREVGLMKALGMTSAEVHELFLAESMLMGLFGGALGISLGIAVGKFTSAVLSLFSLAKQQGILEVSYVPLAFALIIFGLSLVVGIATGIYPAYRAMRITALNALRYE